MPAYKVCHLPGSLSSTSFYNNVQSLIQHFFSSVFLKELGICKLYSSINDYPLQYLLEILEPFVILTKLINDSFVSIHTNYSSHETFQHSSAHTVSYISSSISVIFTNCLYSCNFSFLFLSEELIYYLISCFIHLFMVWSIQCKKVIGKKSQKFIYLECLFCQSVVQK